MKAIVIGAGIGGLASARALRLQGYEVEIFERHKRSKGASIQNFGMFWPIGMSLETRRYAKRSREIWLQILLEQQVYYRESGSLLLATREEEWDVLNEFSCLSEKLDIEVEILAKDQVEEISPVVSNKYLLGAMYSADEVNIDPRIAIPAVTASVAASGVKIQFGKSVESVTRKGVKTFDGCFHGADRVVVAAGYEFYNLFPEVYASLGIQRCKLQMMRTGSLGIDMGPMLAGGLSLLRYPIFSGCASLDKLERRLKDELPLAFKYGIHAMMSQHNGGELCMGDSHEYGDVDDSNSSLINSIILKELSRMVKVPLQPVENWNGYYGKSLGWKESAGKLGEGVDLFFPNGGIGMTLSFGLAEAYFSKSFGQDLAGNIGNPLNSTLG